MWVVFGLHAATAVLHCSSQHSRAERELVTHGGHGGSRKDVFSGRHVNELLQTRVPQPDLI